MGGYEEGTSSQRDGRQRAYSPTTKLLRLDMCVLGAGVWVRMEPERGRKIVIDEIYLVPITCSMHYTYYFNQTLQVLNSNIPILQMKKLAQKG